MTAAAFSPPDLPQLAQRLSQLQPPDPLAELQPAWQAHLARAQQLVPDICSEAGGESLYLDALSPGCQACQAGSWDCVFVEMRCNLACGFCYSPLSIPADYRGSALGANFEQIAANHARLSVTGVAFSGGEPLLQPEQLLDWLARFKERFPDRYYWAYTNGWLATRPLLQRLAELGLAELRFNLAATGYTHPRVLANLAAAVEVIPAVTVEIPAIPAHAEQLLSSLATWNALGVRYLNLHELLYEPGTPAASFPGARQALILPDGHRTALDPHSRELTLQVMQQVRAAGLSLAVNDCSLQSKLRQLRSRRRSLSALTRSAYEKLVAQEYLVSCCAYRGPQDYHWLHPDRAADAPLEYPRYRLTRLAPLSLEPGQHWVRIEKL